MKRGSFRREFLAPLFVAAILFVAVFPFNSPDEPRPVLRALKQSDLNKETLKEMVLILRSMEGQLATIRNVTITTYHMEESQTDSSPCIGAWGDLVVPGQTCAVSRDLIWGPPYLSPGDIAIVGGKPWLIVDLMNERFTKRVDLLVAPWVQFKRVEDVTFIKQKR